MPSKASWELAAGDEIVPGRHVLRRLGGGTRFEVFLCSDDRMWTTVVAKVLRPDRVESRSARAALVAEAEVLAALAHPRIVRLFDAVTDGPRPHLVLEHVEAPTLGTLIKRSGRLPLEQVLPLGISLCSALHYMKAVGWVHLDVKPSNILMGISPILVDFSIARTIEAARVIDGHVGTRAYMAPEQCAPGDDGLGPAADVWGLGVTLYEALSAGRPFPAVPKDAEGEDRYPQLTQEPAPFGRNVPGVLAEIIQGCLARDPAARPTASDVALALEPMVAAMPSKPRLRRSRPKLG